MRPPEFAGRTGHLPGRHPPVRPSVPVHRDRLPVQDGATENRDDPRLTVRVLPRAEGARNYTRCDSLLIGERCGAHTVPYIEMRNRTARVEHEATTGKISDDQLFYCRQRGLSEEDALSLIVNGFCKEVLKELPMEFAVEAQKLLAVSLEGSVG